MLQKHAPSQSAKDIYLLTGEDEFRKEQALKRLKQKLFPNGADSLNYNLYYGKDSSVEDIIQSLDTTAMAGEKKLIVLKNPESLPVHEKALLVEYIKAPNKTKNVFVIFCRPSAAKSKEFIDQISAHAKKLDFSMLKSIEISSWITREFSLRKKAIERRSADMIAEAVQGDITAASSVVNQIISFIGDRDKALAQDVINFMPDIAAGNKTFELLDSINDKNTQLSLKIFRGLLRSGTNPSQVIGLLTWHVTRLLDIKRFLARKVSKDILLSYFRMSGHRLNMLISQSEIFNAPGLRKILRELMETDLMLKRSGIKGDLFLELLIVKWSRI